MCFNNPPKACPTSATTNEDTAVYVNVLANASDPDCDILSIASVSDPAHGTASIVNGKVLYTPDPNYNGTDTFTYVITDEHGATVTQTATITVKPVNDDPTACPTSATTPEDTPVTVDVLAKAHDIDGDALSISSVTSGQNGTTAIVNGKVVYTPKANFNGTDTFSYIIVDGKGGAVTQKATITVTPVNDAPIADPTSAVTNQGVPVAVDVIAKAFDVDGDALTISQLNNGSHGTTAVVNGKVVYTPDSTFYGNDSFTYTISDGKGGTVTQTATITVIHINHDPKACATVATTPEETPVTVDVLARATDIDGDTLSISSVTNGSHGTTAIVNGKVVYTPNANYNGTDIFTYVISDGQGGTVTTSATITVTPVNDPPTACPVSATTPEDTPVTVDVLAKAHDIDGDVLTISQVNDAPHGSTAIVNGKVVYTPDANYNGQDSFTYVISDGKGGYVTQTATITVCPVNDPPVADPTYATTNENTPVTVDVLAKASDVDGDILSISQVNSPSHGTASVVNGKVVYTPNTNYSGQDSFTYVISDGKGGYVTQTATICVNDVNHDPTACPTCATTPEDTPVTVDVLAKAQDVDGDTLTISQVNDAPHGSTAIVNGKVLYTPDANYNGQDSFTYVISDGKGGFVTQTATITVCPVNDPPTACPVSATTPEDTPVTVDVLAKAHDVDGDALTISQVNNPSHGTASVVNGKVLYTPNANYNGQDSFTYVISDGKGGYVTQTATITVCPVNDPPVADPTYATTPENTPVTVDVLAKASDVDGDVLSISKVNSPSHGTASVVNGKVVYTPNTNYSGQDSFTYVISDGNGGFVTQTATICITDVNHDPTACPTCATTPEDTPVTVDVLAKAQDVDGDTLTISQVNDAAHGSTAIVNGKVVYTPDANYNGQDSFTYTISDGNGGFVTQKATITVCPVNDAPTAGPTCATTPEDTPVTVDVLAKASDVDGDVLTISQVNDAAHGSTAIVNGKVIYTPDKDYNGKDSFTYVISDGNGGYVTQTATITVTPVNDPPIADPTYATTPENTPVTVDVLAKASDVDGDTLTISQVNNPSHGTASIVNGKVVYTPNTNYSGQDSFTYVISDGNGGFVTQKATICVSDVNHDPTACPTCATTPEDTPVTVDVLAKAQDVDGDTLTISQVNDAAHGSTAIVNGKVVYTPDANYNGKDSFTYVISDGNGGYVTQTATITVTPVNDPPTASPVCATTPEDTPITVDVLAKAQDVDGDALTISQVNDAPHGSTTIVNGKVVYTPDANYNGKDSFTYVISDGNGGYVTQTATITVTPVNDPPTADPTYATTPENTPVTVDVLAKAYDVDGDALTISQVNDAPHGSTTIVNGKVVYTPDTNYSGKDSFTYVISDGNGGFVTQTATICVSDVNHDPTACPTCATTPEDTPVTVDVLAKAQDVDGDVLTISQVNDAPHGSTAIVNGKVVYTPDKDYNGKDSFTYVISDGNGGFVTQTATITVTPVNDPPIADPTCATTKEDTPVTVDVLAKASDVDGDILSISQVNDAAHGSTTIVNGKVLYTPDANYNGQDSFTYVISDGNGGFVTQTATITVTPVNDPPVADPTYAVTEENVPVTVDVLAKAHDVDGDTLTIDQVNDAAHGSVQIVNGKVVYTPDKDYSGMDSFTYKISDGNGGYATQTATIKVNDVCKPVVAAEEYGYITGDPHLRGGDGEYFDFNAKNGTVYNALSDNNLTYHIVIGTIPKWSPATGVVQSSITVDGETSKSVIFFDKNGNATVQTSTTNGTAGCTDKITIQRGEVYNLADGGKVYYGLAYGGGTDGLSMEERLIIETAEGYIITQVVRDGAYIDSNIETGSKGVFEDGIMPTGLIGDTFDADSNIRVALDDQCTGILNNPLSYYQIGNSIVTAALTTHVNAYSKTITSYKNNLYGTSGNDIFYSSKKENKMAGSKGDDLYYVDQKKDYVIENSLEGNDSVVSSVTFTLDDNVENLRLAGKSNINAIGNANDNLIIGNDGKNKLDGKGGADTLIGGKANDTYYVDNQFDLVLENAGEGNDTVVANISYSLTANVENLTLGTNALNATGNDLSNVITGNALNNIITGGKGNDKLKGGAGDDTYKFKAGDGIDTIDDKLGNNKIVFDSSVIQDTVAFKYKGNDLIIDYGTVTGQDEVIIKNVKNNASFQVELSSIGESLTIAEINGIISDMTSFAKSEHISISSMNKIKDNDDIMALFSSSWNQ